MLMVDAIEFFCGSIRAMVPSLTHAQIALSPAPIPWHSGGLNEPALISA